MRTSRLQGEWPRIGIRPAIDGRMGGVRESLENRTVNMAKSVVGLRASTGNYSKIFTVLTVSFLCLFPCSIFSHAQDYKTWVMDHWHKDKEVAFKEAKEQDKFILLFVGRPTCSACQDMSELLCDPANPIKQILDDKYVTMYSWFDDEDSRNAVYEYIETLYEERLAGLARQLPWLFIINPDREGESLASYFRPNPEYRPDEETMRKFLAVDLLESNDLDWYADENKVFKLAQEQNKYIFKFRGNGTSPNSQTMIKQLTDEPLKQILNDNYILWYVGDDDCGCDIILKAEVTTMDEDDPKPLPYISIINPKAPDIMLEEIWGVQDVETLAVILKKYTVSNEKIFKDNSIFVSGNFLHIANQMYNEQISIYSISGHRIMTVRKNDYTAAIDLFNLPKGVFFVHSSAGWSAKFVR